ncbi:MAG: YggT family protein [Holosporales bacterium]|nr:YggT family protein [Holosporales bacterium]
MDCIEYLLIGYIILGWFVFFGVIKNRNSVFLRIYIFLMTKIEPLLALIRRFLPTVAGFDFSPLVVFFGLHLAKVLVIQVFCLLLRAFNA